MEFPNRKLSFRWAASGPDEQYNDHAWANIAAANMVKGDTFEMGRREYTVVTITERTLKLIDANGKTKTLDPNRDSWEQFKRDLGDQLVLENMRGHRILKPPLPTPLLDILMRDPAAAIDERGSVYLQL